MWICYQGRYLLTYEFICEKIMNKKQLGRIGEATCRDFLQKEGYHILMQNYVVPFGEIDIICQKEDEIVFIEVKTRLSKICGNGAESVTEKKQETIRRVAQWYLMAEKPAFVHVRFDVIELELNHIKNAF